MLKNLAERLALALEPWKARLGEITLFVGIGMVTMGFPFQIFKNWREHECGIDPVLITVALVLYVVRIPYQMSVRAWYLLPSDVLGLLLSSVLVWQYLNY